MPVASNIADLMPHACATSASVVASLHYSIRPQEQRGRNRRPLRLADELCIVQWQKEPAGGRAPESIAVSKAVWPKS
jgi:hypothetical protein